MKKGVGEKGDTMEKKEDENIEKIKLISQLMGQEMPKEAELLKMMETAKKMQQFFGAEENIHNEKRNWKKDNFTKSKSTLTSKEDTMLFARTKEENMIYASIPFFDR